jgi:biopolymer transport protein ExbD
MEIKLPEKPKVEDKQPLVNEKKVLTIMLAAENKIYWYTGITDPKVERTDFSHQGIRKVLVEKNAEIKDMIVLVKPLDESKYRNVIDLIDEMNISNVTRFSFADITNTDKELIKDSGL